VSGSEVRGTTLAVCTRDRPAFVSRVVTSILQGAELPDELIVVDQTSQPHPVLSTFSTDRCAFRYLHSKTIGLSRSRNIAIRAAAHPLIVFTDDDVIVPSDWFGTIRRSLESAGPRTVVTGRVIGTDAEVPGAFAPSLHPGTERVVYEGRPRQDPLATFNVAFPRSAATEIGGFDPRLGPGTPFPAAEDNDFGFRLLEAGYRIVFDPTAVVYHRAWRDEGSYVPLRFAYGRGQGAFYAKHLSFDDRYMLRRMIGTLVNHVRRLPRAALNDVLTVRSRRQEEQRRSSHNSFKSPNLAVGEIAWITGFLAGMVEWLRTNRRRL
jgi:GT2 family glycosyltransferase